MDRKTTASILKAKRIVHKLTQKEIAEKAGISLTAYQSYERGEVSPTLETLQKIYNAYGFRFFLTETTL